MRRSPLSPFAPLPGTTRRPRGLFIDRWGTLLVLPANQQHGRSASDVVFVEGVLEALFRASQRGWKLYLIGNEEAVARGQVAEQEWNAIQERLLLALTRAGIALQRDYTCTLHPEGEGRFRGDSVYALPNTGAFYHAAHVDGVQLDKSWVVGDSTLELAAGWRAGLRLAGVQSGLALKDATLEVQPELWGTTLSEVLETLLELEAAAA
jgi:histidinol phosphatase-like enzyme